MNEAPHYSNANKEARDRFNHMSLFDKAKILSGYCHLIWRVDNVERKYNVLVYELNGTFIEAFVNIHTRDVDEIWMPSYQELNSYLSHISIKDLWR